MSELPPPPPPPPSYSSFQQPYAPTAVCARIGTLTRWLVLLLAITMAGQAISTLMQLMLRDAARDFLDDPTHFDFATKAAPYLAISGLVAVAAIAQLVILVIWTFRIARNASVLGRVDQKFRPGATIAVNLLGSCTLGILPFFMWRELWRASDPDAYPGDPSWRTRAVSPLPAVQLGLGLAAMAVSAGLGAARMFQNFGSSTSDTDFAKQLQDQLASIIISGLFTVAAGAVFLLFVRQLAERHMRATGER